MAWRIRVRCRLICCGVEVDGLCLTVVKAPLHLHTGGRRDGFTLLEMVLAAAILIIISVTVYDFTSVTMRTADISLQESDHTMMFGGFRRRLEAQLASLPANQNGSLIGMVVDGKNGRQDALQLVCPAGNAVLTPDAKGYYEITLDLREMPRGSGHYALGMERTPWTDDDDDDDDDDDSARPKATSTKVTDVTRIHQPLPSDWVKLMDGVKGLEFSYFDARLNGWVDKWTDTSTLPNLVRVRISTGEGRAPYELVERVPGGAANAHVIATATATNGLNPLGNANTTNGTRTP